MKKKYVTPESKIFAFNMSENIAASSGLSQIEGFGIIKFEQIIDGCRGIYSGVTTSPVTVTTNNFLDYYHDMLQYDMETIRNCLTFSTGG